MNCGLDGTAGYIIMSHVIFVSAPVPWIRVWGLVTMPLQQRIVDDGSRQYIFNFKIDNMYGMTEFLYLEDPNLPISNF